MFQFLYRKNDVLEYWTPVVMIALGVGVFLTEACGGLRAAYGRYNKSNIGLSARLAWFIQESPAFFIPFYLLLHKGISFMFDSNNQINSNFVLVLLFLIHYFNR